MHIKQLLTLDRTLFDVVADSKKRALEIISRTAVKGLPDITAKEVLVCLSTRERLGATAISKGLALPHCRLKKLVQPIAVLVKLHHAIDFNAPDQQPVELIFTLLVPEHANDEHLAIIANLAETLRHKPFRDKLRHASSQQQLFRMATEQNR